MADKGPKQFVEVLGPFSGGVNSGVPPLLLPKDTMSSALNTTVRNQYVTQRSVYRKIALTGQNLINDAIGGGPYQGGVFYNPDSGPEQIVMEIGGQFLVITPDATNPTAVVTKPPYNGGVVPNPAGQPQSWLWQAEEFVIVNDGLSNPLFYDGISIARSNWGAKVSSKVYSTATAIVPSVNSTVTLTVNSTTDGAETMTAGQTVTVQNIGTFLIQSVPDGTHVILVNLTAPVGATIPVGSAPSPNVFWYSSSDELPPGRMGAYGMGRNWVSLLDGRQFVASDQVGGSSGTPGVDYRDSVLHITENLYLAGGGNFSVPGSIGDIKAMRFAATLDASLGQGPLQVFTHKSVFSCNTPVDRLTWQDVTSPILTESLISNGALGQNNTINVNGDILFRSVDGLRSLILARRDFDTWGNVPQSFEVDSLLSQDDQTLLNYGSAIVFDNRYLFTATPRQIKQGVVHSAIVPLNFDPLSTLRGKAPSVYDSIQWTGLNIFQLFVGEFNGRERAFALSWNEQTEEVELYEILPTANTQVYDNDVSRIVWAFNTASLFRETDRVFKRLFDGELYVDSMEGQVDFQVWYKPDQWPCFVPWHQWSQCQTQPDVGHQPGFRPRMGLGEPSSQYCDLINNRPLRDGYTFDLRVVVTGKCRFLGGRFKAIEESEPLFARPICEAPCP